MVEKWEGESRDKDGGWKCWIKRDELKWGDKP